MSRLSCLRCFRGCLSEIRLAARSKVMLKTWLPSNLFNLHSSYDGPNRAPVDTADIHRYSLNYELRCLNKLEPSQLDAGFLLRTNSWPMSCTLNLSPGQRLTIMSIMSCPSLHQHQQKWGTSSHLLGKHQCRIPEAIHLMELYSCTIPYKELRIKLLACGMHLTSSSSRHYCPQIFDMPSSGRCWTHWSLARF